MLIGDLVWCFEILGIPPKVNKPPFLIRECQDPTTKGTGSYPVVLGLQSRFNPTRDLRGLVHHLYFSEQCVLTEGKVVPLWVFVTGGP